MNYPGNHNSKLPKVGKTIFSVMTELAQAHDAINLSQGFPDFEVDGNLVDLVTKYMVQGKNQYAPMAGSIELREQVTKLVSKQYSAVVNPESEVTITAGATQAIYTAITAVIRDGDEVIIFTPAYDCYAPAVELSGGKAIYVPLKKPHYNIDWEEVKKVMSRHTRMIIVNTPHNPTGTILTAQDMAQLEKITAGNDIMVLSDEVYENILFDGYEHQSVLRYPNLAERSFVISSFGKTFHATGWKMSYCIAPENLMAEFRKVHQYVVFAVNHPVQLALAEYLQTPDLLEKTSLIYQHRRDFFIDSLKGSRFELRPSAGTYFQLLDYSEISDEPDVDFAKRLTREHGVASIPVSVFYHNPSNGSVLRFCFAKSEETLSRAASILKSL